MTIKVPEGWEGYNGTSGHQGYASEDGEPDRRARASRILHIVLESKCRGMTSLELENLTGWGHGVVSGPLSTMHKDGIITRLAEKRGRHEVYVGWEYVAGRQVRPHASGRTRNAAFVELCDLRNSLTSELWRGRRGGYNDGIAYAIALINARLKG